MSSTFRVGEWHIGVRSNTVETDSLLRRVLSVPVDDGLAAPPNYSVRLADDGTGKRGARGLNLLYASGQPVVRSRTPRRVLSALANYLSAHVDPPSDGLFRVHALPAVADDGRAVLLPRSALVMLKVLQPRLARLGVRLVDVPWAAVDPVAAELVVSAPSVGVDLSALEPAGPATATPDEPPPVGPGRYPLEAWAFAISEDEVGHRSRARAVAATLPTVDLGTGLRPALDALGRLFTEVTPLAVSYSGPQELVGQLRDLLAG